MVHLFLLVALVSAAPTPDWSQLESAVIVQVRRAGGRNALCSGVVIARQTVLTTAHCVDEALSVTVLTGSEPAVLPTAVIPARSWWAHPSYDVAVSNFEYDLAVVLLENAVPVGLPRARFATPRDFGAGGAIWERVGFGERSARNLKTWTDPKFMGSSGATALKLLDRFAVAGDSGGPVYLRVRGRRMLAGIHSTWDRAGVSYAVSVSTLSVWISSFLNGAQ